MTFLKSSLDGIGTAAGVAWPLFGILASSLGLAAGSGLAFASGSVSAVLFCTVCIATFYVSYQTMRREDNWLKTHYFEEQKKLSINLMQCLNSSRATHCEQALMDILHDAVPNLARTFQLDNIQTSNKRRAFIIDLLSNVQKKPMPKNKLFKTGMISGFGAFGSIAGCTAGFIGLLTGLGLVSGFSAFPIIGLGALAVAGFFAGVVAVEAGKKALQRHKMEESIRCAKILRKKLKTLHLQNLTGNRAFQQLEENASTVHTHAAHYFFPDDASSGKNKPQQEPLADLVSNLRL